ncbi:hypothetical protein HYT23_03080 [Candidatus Pacearchaeota archaeon]|nr:hypothetical protein [Candidatus Pacearchaeota archaeon]
MDYKKIIPILGVSLLSFLGCSKKDDVLYTERISIDASEFIVEVRPIDKVGRRLWIYDCGIDRSKSQWAGVSFALDEDGNGKIDRLKGPLLAYILDHDSTRQDDPYAITVNKKRNDSLSGKLNQVLRNSEIKVR